jgi:hypothetical protein
MLGLKQASFILSACDPSTLAGVTLELSAGANPRLSFWAIIKAQQDATGLIKKELSTEK